MRFQTKHMPRLMRWFDLPRWFVVSGRASWGVRKRVPTELYRGSRITHFQTTHVITECCFKRLQNPASMFPCFSQMILSLLVSERTFKNIITLMKNEPLNVWPSRCTVGEHGVRVCGVVCVSGVRAVCINFKCARTSVLQHAAGSLRHDAAIVRCPVGVAVWNVRCAFAVAFKYEPSIPCPTGASGQVPHDHRKQKGYYPPSANPPFSRLLPITSLLTVCWPCADRVTCSQALVCAIDKRFIGIIYCGYLWMWWWCVLLVTMPLVTTLVCT